MAVSAPAITGLRPVQGSLRLIVVRWVLALAAGWPAIFAVKGALATAATQPWYTEAPDPLPLPQLFGVMGAIGSAAPMLIVGAAVAWLVHQLLTAAAIEILDPHRETGPVRLWRRMIDTGWSYFLPYLRISLIALVFLLIGSRVLSMIFDGLAERGAVEGWTGKTLSITLPVWHALLMLAWAGGVGTFAWWSRVVLLRGRRRYVRRLLTVVPRVIWRNPFQGFLLHWLLGVASILAGAAVLFAWRQTPGVATGWFAVWLALLALQAFVWHWRLRTLSLIWSKTALDDLRGVPDAPWGIFRRFRPRLRRSAGSTSVSTP